VTSRTAGDTICATMENWSLRRSQSARIVGTTDPYRLDDVLATARSHAERQASAVPRGGTARWQSIGPDNVPGRIGALGISHQDSRVLYAGSAAGGVYKTVDGGASWDALWSHQESLAVGGLAVAPSNHDVVYVATGEWEDNVSTTRYHHFPGVGVYHTRDGGRTWTLSPIRSTWTAAVAVDPVDPDRVLVAGDRSLHRSRDGGRSWDTTEGNADGVFTGTISDVALDPDDPRLVYIGVHRSGVWRSTDGGDLWTPLALPDTVAADLISPKLALAGQPGRPPFVALLTNGVVFTSRDGGDTFLRQDPVQPPLFPGDPPKSYAAWCTSIAVDPTDPDVLLVGHVSLWRSSRGGRNWTLVGVDGDPPTEGHHDQQAIVFDPRDHAHLFVATDGGVFESRDNGRRWSARSRGLVTAQCYTVTVSRTAPLRIGITTQDNRVYQSDGSPRFEIRVKDEGGWIEYDPTDARVLYVDTRNTPLSKSTNGGDTWTPLGLESDATIREALAIARPDAGSLLLVDRAGQVHRSNNGGASWRVTLAPAGVMIGGVEYAPDDAQVAYAVSTDGRVWWSENGGDTWRELDRGPLPERPVNDI
jgi:photosystem II stability/assembly factor-like uncharacterized protein